MYKEAGGFRGNVDRWQIVEHVPPCFTVNFAGCSDPSTKIELMALSAPTPETERTTHYFFGFTRNFDIKSEQAERLFAEGMVKVFNEDIPILNSLRMGDDHLVGSDRKLATFLRYSRDYPRLSMSTLGC